MRTYDLNPYLRNSIGLDRTFDLLVTLTNAEAGGYPPYNIEKIDDEEYRVTIAVAGFSAQDIDIEVHGNALTITGRRPDADKGRNYVYQGIAGRAFERRFHIADHVKIDNASLQDGLLNIELRREVPEELKPRKIAINGEKSENLRVVNKASVA